jgi:hypothetical protein
MGGNFIATSIGLGCGLSTMGGHFGFGRGLSTIGGHFGLGLPGFGPWPASSDGHMSVCITGPPGLGPAGMPGGRVGLGGAPVGRFGLTGLRSCEVALRRAVTADAMTFTSLSGVYQQRYGYGR